MKRAHIELFARSLEQHGKARATVARRLSTIAGFYRYCVEEQLIPASPAVHVRRPRPFEQVRNCYGSSFNQAPSSNQRFFSALSPPLSLSVVRKF